MPPRPYSILRNLLSQTEPEATMLQQSKCYFHLNIFDMGLVSSFNSSPFPVIQQSKQV